MFDACLLQVKQTNIRCDRIHCCRILAVCTRLDPGLDKQMEKGDTLSITPMVTTIRELFSRSIKCSEELASKEAVRCQVDEFH